MSTRTRLAASTLVILVTGPVTVSPAEQLTRAEMIQALVESVELHDACPNGSPPPGTAAEVRAEVARYAAECPGIPDVVDGLTAETRGALLARKLDLMSGNPEYVRAAVRVHLMGMVAAARSSRLLRPLSGPEEQELAGRLDMLLNGVCRVARRYLGSNPILTPEDVGRALGQARATWLRWAGSSFEVSMKRVPSVDEINALVQKMDPVLAALATELQGEAQTLSQATGDHSQVKAAMRDAAVARILGLLGEEAYRITVSPEIAAMSPDDLVPGLAEARRTYFDVWARETEARQAAWRAAFFARVEARDAALAQRRDTSHASDGLYAPDMSPDERR
ncbi:MAG: hypothetical protein ACPMAQ_17155, partial [Phycisphaerae bacterium]